MEQPIIKIWDIGDECYQVDISRRLKRSKGYKILKDIVDIEMKENPSTFADEQTLLGAEALNNG